MNESVKRTIRQRMVEKLSGAFAPQSLNVIDESDKHAGHAGAPDQGGETHFRVEMVSENFAGKNRIERHRAVNAVLVEEFADGVHALALNVRAPGEN